MPPFPGEETLATVYADLHTYFAPPSPRPALHRFDKSSYFYLYYNSTRQTSRIEVAINPGTPDQAAFNGFLDNVKVVNSHRFPTLLTLVVDGQTRSPNTSPASARAGRDPDEWRLVSSDPRDPGTTKYRIHTIDVYFWVREDAKLIVDIFKRLLQPHQLDTDLDEVDEDQDHHDVVSPVVQNLEKVAISDPAYKNHDHDAHPVPQQQPVQLPPPPPPPGAPQTSPAGNVASISPTSATASVGASTSSVKAPASSTTDYTPLAYNPAAPAAPEPIAHREDTPPPVDAVDGTGLASAAKHDAYGRPQQQHPSLSGPPGSQPISYGQYGSPPAPSFGPQASQHSFGPQATATVQPSFGPQATSTIQPAFNPQTAPSGVQQSPRTSIGSGFGSATSPDSRHPSIAAQTYAPSSADPNSHIFGQQSPSPPVQTPGAQFYSSINGGPHKPLQHVQPQYPDYLAAAGQASSPPPPAAPIGGYSNYQYTNQPQPQAAGANPYDIHNQVYRPTEVEHSTHHHSKPKPSSSHHKPSQTERLEKGVGKFFKKIEKKIG